MNGFNRDQIRAFDSLISKVNFKCASTSFKEELYQSMPQYYYKDLVRLNESLTQMLQILKNEGNEMIKRPINQKIGGERNGKT